MMDKYAHIIFSLLSNSTLLVTDYVVVVLLTIFKTILTMIILTHPVHFRVRGNQSARRKNLRLSAER